MAAAPVSRVEVPPDPADSGTTLQVRQDDGDKFPTPPFTALVWPSQQIPTAENSERPTVTAVVGDELTVERGSPAIAIYRDLAIAAISVQDLVQTGATATADAAFGSASGPYQLEIVSPQGSVTALGTATAFTDDGTGNVSYNFEAEVGGQWEYRWMAADGRAIAGRVFAAPDPTGA